MPERTATPLYHIDLSLFSIDKFLGILKTIDLLPSQRILLEDIDARFDILKNAGITELSTLLSSLKSKKLIENMSTKYNIPFEYLDILRRVAGGYRPTPPRLDSFPGIPPLLINTLETLNIKTAKHLFEYNGNIDADIEELYCLVSLSRVNGVGPVFTRMLYDTGIKTISELAHADKAKVFARMMKNNEKYHYTRANFRESDMQYVINFAIEIEENDSLVMEQ